jgi:hypothetical protein
VIGTENVKFTVEAHVETPRLFGKFKEIKMTDFITRSSKVGEIDLFLFSSLFNEMTKIGIPVMNEFIVDGFSLPTVKGITLTNSEIHFN